MSRIRIRVFLSALLGNIVEYYDYALYGYTAALLAQHFFPQDVASVGLLKTFAVYATGALFKPLGAIIFGTLGDKWGRTAALRVNMMGIAIPTLVVGLLPGYHEWGIYATLCLLLCRIAQGIFIAGETDGVRIFIYEHVSPKYACFANGLVWASATTGIYFAAFAAAMMMKDGMPDWAWRVPFIVGGFLGLGVYVLRQSLVETPAFLAHKKETPTHTPLWTAIKNNKSGLCFVILLYAAVGGTYHFYMIFWGTYLYKILGVFTAAQGTYYISMAILLYTIAAPFFGFCADRVGVKRFLSFSLLSVFCLIALNAWALQANHMGLPVMLLTSLGLSAFHAPAYVFLMQRFQVGERYRCVSLGHNISSALFSQSAPFIGTLIWTYTKTPSAPLFYFGILSALGAISLMMGQKTMPPLSSPQAASSPTDIQD
jgi:MHS family proline/betaine transporter-like MFS transporter